MSRCYPVSLNIENRLCLVVGGGNVAERKVLTLLDYGARIRLVAPAVTGKLAAMASSGKITLIEDSYKADYLEGVFLVICATDDDAVNASVSQDSMARGILINVVDDPPRGNFYVPAIVRRGSLQIAVSTDGKSPMLARKIKERLAGDFPAGYGDIVDLIGELRERIISETKDSVMKDKRLSGMLDNGILELLRDGKFDLAKERIINAYTGGGSESPDRSR
ncbi:MAG: siroheme synthase [Peptococcaceae bacterium BICA1-7]|nr:MAG: siroheme synthase [Peptococcaceae bacterium BICA1-7]HBV96790.1 bifunctional precorrin-2 dehydrogenase/sirohydrochlorin ferrochelatase [Desulfotomaculum sp.]